MPCRCFTVLPNFHISTGNLPIRVVAVTGGHCGFIDGIGFGAHFFNNITGYMVVVFFKKQIAVINRPDLVLQVDIHSRAAEDIFTVG